MSLIDDLKALIARHEAQPAEPEAPAEPVAEPAPEAPAEPEAPAAPADDIPRDDSGAPRYV